MSESANNRRFLIAAALGFAAFFAVDSYLFAAEGFRRAMGDATQEGQVLRKVERAAGQAAIADVIFFGSSYVRSGISGEPFLERGLVPFNFGVSGGAQVYDYFALQRIAPELTRRQRKPRLVVEFKTDALLKSKDNLWSEYPQYIAIVRSRTVMLRNAPVLWRHFSDYGMTSQFISGVMIPSSIYRSHAVPVLGADATHDGDFYGPEDFSGYSALYTVATPSMVLSGREEPAPLADFYPAKLELLRRFLALAVSTGCPITLYQSPTMMMGRDSRVLDSLFEALSVEFPGVEIIRTSDYHLEIADFDEGRHPNIRGADKISRQLIPLLGLQSSEPLEARMRAGFDAAVLPPFEQWTLTGAKAANGELAFEAQDRLGSVIAQSPPIDVRANRDWVLEFATPEIRGNVMVAVSWQDAETGQAREVTSVSQLQSPPWDGSARFFLRSRPKSGTVVVRVLDYGPLAGREPVSGRLKLLRLWSNR
ncbi:MAG TPA: hypothetical protein VNT81_20145 [Vicinamibacterales bacterium]|nr:hypothetical protein [Vicinamibacterales bacterium]